jgi:GNAT superfamily N-acetyltransferase
MTHNFEGLLMGEITIRKSQESDAENVSSILLEARNWLVSIGRPLWKVEELSPEHLRPEVAAGLFGIATVNGEPVGCVRFQTEDKLFWPDVPQDESAFIHRLAVRRNAAGGAVSSALIEWAKNQAMKLGKKYLRLDCDAKTIKLCQVYEKANFRKHSERKVGPFLVARFESPLDTSHI